MSHTTLWRDQLLLHKIIPSLSGFLRAEPQQAFTLVKNTYTSCIVVFYFVFGPQSLAFHTFSVVSYTIFFFFSLLETNRPFAFLY